MQECFERIKKDKGGKKLPKEYKSRDIVGLHGYYYIDQLRRCQLVLRSCRPMQSCFCLVDLFFRWCEFRIYLNEAGIDHSGCLQLPGLSTNTGTALDNFVLAC